MLAVLNVSPLPTAITRAGDGVILFANPACLRMLGWEAGGFVGATTADVGFWAGAERRAAMLERLAADGSVWDLEEEIRTRSGETRIVLTSISTLELDGEACLIGHIHDITERHRVDEQLRESEERFRQIAETSPQAFVLREVEPGRVLYASPAVARIFGIEPDALRRDPLAAEKLIHPEDGHLVEGSRALTSATDFEFRIVRPDGETRWIRTRAEPVRVGGAGVSRIASISEDITEDRALREALRASEELYRLLAENSTDVIGRLSRDQQIEYVSPASVSVYGHEPEAMVGRFGWEFVHPDDLAALREDFSARPDRPDVVTNSYRVRRGDGTYVWIEATVRALVDPIGGGVREFHTVARDVTGRRLAETEVRRAKEEAERANAAKSRFLSRMSHELRTPLNAILGFGDLVERGDLLPAQREHLGQITKAGRHLLELINEVLDITRIEDGKLHLSLEPVDVGRVVSEALSMLEPLAAARSVTLMPPRSPESDVHVLADRQRLKQVMLNLLSNAVKYNREDGEVEITTTGGGGRTARIDVRDTGIGIAAEDLAAAFAEFERLGAETTEVEGTGLGLALAKRLIETMGGAIGVDSEVGRGTTFWLELPVASAKSATAPPAQARAVEPRRDARTVLYIEDNPSNIRLVEAILNERPEVTLLVAQQGSLGLDLAYEHRPALVLLDLNLPDISGEDVLRRLRGDRRTAGLTIVVISADATPGQVTRLRRAGADGYLTKPFEIEQFLAVIDGQPAPHVAGDVPQAGASPAVPADSARSAERPLDPSALETLRRLYPDTDAVEQFVVLFLNDSPAQLESLRAAAAADDDDAVRCAAHAWRGACTLTGAQRLCALLGDIETRAGLGGIPDEEQLTVVREAYEEAGTALRREFD
jgi:PAS domain S-box-containing protein